MRISNNKMMPSGFQDLKGNNAQNYRKISNNIIDYWLNYGYQYVEPPLLEFEQSLTLEKNQNNSVLRLIDGDNQQVMVIRPDITLQIGRIAENMLNANKNKPHHYLKSIQSNSAAANLHSNGNNPIRLCYLGKVIRNSSYHNSTEHRRQYTQLGIELIFAKNPYAEYEVIKKIIDPIDNLFTNDSKLHFYIDYYCPNIAIDVAKTLPEELQKNIIKNLINKDNNAIQKLSQKYDNNSDEFFIFSLLDELCKLYGDYRDYKERLENIFSHHAFKILPNKLQEKIFAYQQSIKYLDSKIATQSEHVTISIDLSENLENTYHQNFSFAIFAQNQHNICREIARGGQYIINNQIAVGATIVIENLLELIDNKPLTKQSTILVPLSISFEDTIKLQGQGYVLYSYIENEWSAIPIDELMLYAKNHGYDYIFTNDQIQKL